MTPTASAPTVAHDVADPLAFFTVSELLKHRGSRGASLLAGDQIATTRVIKGASVQESPIEDFVRPDELVMTTAIGLERPTDFARFVREVGRAGAAALAVARPPGSSKIPEAAVRAAEGIGLPLIQFPWKLRFSEVSELILRRTLEYQTNLLRASEEIQELFTRIVLKGGSIHSLAESVEQRIGRRIAVIDRWGVQIHPESPIQRISEDAWRQTPIVADTRRLGMLFVRGTTALGRVENQVVRHAATAAALVLLIDWAEAQGEARAKAELLTALLNGWVGGPKELAARAEAVGLDPDGQFAAVCIRSSAPERDPGRYAEDARTAVERAFEARRLPALQSWQGGDGTLVIPMKGSATMRQLIGALVEEIGTSLARKAPGTTVDCGVGRPVRLAEIPRSLHEAQTAARLARSQSERAPAVYYEDLGVFAVLHEVMVDPSAALDELQERCLARLIAYERERGLPLIETLAALFAENGNVSSTARRLRINRQSLLYRLEKVGRLTELDLARASDRLALELAVTSFRARSQDGTATSSPSAGPNSS